MRNREKEREAQRKGEGGGGNSGYLRMTAIKFNSHTKAVITTRRPLQLKLKISFHFDWKIYMLLNVLESLEVSRATRLMAMLMCHCHTRGVPGEGTIRQRMGGW